MKEALNIGNAVLAMIAKGGKSKMCYVKKGKNIIVDIEVTDAKIEGKEAREVIVDDPMLDYLHRLSKVENSKFEVWGDSYPRFNLNNKRSLMLSSSLGKRLEKVCEPTTSTAVDDNKITDAMIYGIGFSVNKFLPEDMMLVMQGKEIKQIIRFNKEEEKKVNKVFLNDWEEEGLIGMISDFENIYITKKEFEAEECPIPNEKYWLEKKSKMQKFLDSGKYDVNFLLASYGYANYSGDAFVLFEKDGQLFEVNGSHCSCYGLEDQWAPDETTVEALRHRLENGRLGADDYSDNVFKDELREVLNNLTKGEK